MRSRFFRYIQKANDTRDFQPAGIIVGESKGGIKPGKYTFLCTWINPFTGKIESEWFEKSEIILFEGTEDEWCQVSGVYSA